MRPSELTDALLASVEALWEACCPDVRALPPLCPSPLPPERARPASREERAPTPHSDGDGEAEAAPSPARFAMAAEGAEGAEEAGGAAAPALAGALAGGLLARLLSARSVALLAARRSPAGWSAAGRLLGWLVRRRLLREADLADACLGLYRRDWPPVSAPPVAP